MKTKTKNILLSLACAIVAVVAALLAVFIPTNKSMNTVDAAADTHINLTYADVDEFEAPEIGAMPDLYVHPVHFCYEVTEVLWMYKTGNYFSDWNVQKPFVAGNTYRVGIVLTASEGYYYDEDLAHQAEINGEKVDYRVIDEQVVLLTKDFTLDSYLTSVNVSNLKVPVAGELPDTEIECANNTYTARVEWYNRTTHTDHDNNEPFKANTSYTAQIYITAKDGYIFDVTADKVQCFVNGVSITVVPSDKKEVFAPVYYEVGYAPVQNIEVTLDKPMPGATPDFDAECSGDGFVKDYNELGYINGVRWLDRVAGIVLTKDDEFVADREYFVSLMIEADEDHEFTSARTYVYLNDKMCIVQSNSGNRVRGFDGTVRTPKAIEQVNVSNLVKPVEGNTPDYWLDVDFAGVTIERIDWEVYVDESDSLKPMGENETFVDGKTYLMSVYMKNSNTDKVFATKLNANEERVIATSVTLDGEKVYPQAGKNEEGERDLYNYMWFYCWYDCESEQVTKAAAWIDTPIAGATPSYNVSLAGDELMVYSVDWSVYTTDASGSSKLEELPSYRAFEKDNTYCVFITVQVKGNRKIDYSPETYIASMSALVNGKRADVYAVKEINGVAVDPSKYAQIACWFDCNGAIIGSVDVSGIVAPVAGERPCYDRTIIGAGYNAVGSYAPTWDITTGKDIYSQKNGVSWWDVTDGGYDYVYENQDFIGGHTYRVQLALEVTGDYRFAVDGDLHSTVVGSVNGLNGEVIPGVMSNEQVELRLSYEFTCEKVAIDSIEVEIDEPVIGEAPNWTKLDSKYFFSNSEFDNEDTKALNGIIWGIYGKNNAFTPNSDVVFEENTEYMVLIYITLKEGYIIEDADKFEVYLNGLKIFDPMVFPYEPANILVMYTFPKTDCTCSIQPVAEVPATCTEDGMKAHYACGKCGTTYKDVNGEELLDYGEEEYMLWATGHNFSNWKAHEEYNNCHVGTCSQCGETEEADCEFVPVFVEGPSKYSKYNGTLFACELCDNEGAFYVDETSCEHIPGEWKENGRMGGTHYRTCECGKVYEEEDCDYALIIEKAPSEYSDMRDVFLYTCKKCGGEHFEPIEGEVVTEESVKDEETNVTVSVPENSETILPEGTTVTAKPVNAENIPEGAKEMMEKSLDSTVDVQGGYDIILYYKDVEIQPYASVSVTIPIGEDVEKSDNMTILHYDDFTIREVETVVFNWEDGTVTFETDHFSKYLIAKVTPNPEPEKPDDSTSSGDSSIDSTIPETPEQPETSEKTEKKGCFGTVSGLSVSILGLAVVCLFNKKREEL